MCRNILAAVSLVGVLYGCNGRKTEADLQTMVDSLTVTLQANHDAAQALQDVAVMIDSIDANRNALKARMVERAALDDYEDRMREIKYYVREVETRIAFLENRVKVLGIASGYTHLIKKLTGSLEIRNRELAMIQSHLARHRNKNVNLLQVVTMQEDEIDNQLDQLNIEANRIDSLNKKINELSADSRIDEADAYFARARAVEEAANRTRLAPRKKRNATRQALELYKMAATYGKEEAKAKVTELEKKI